MAAHKIQWNGLVDDSELDSLASADNNEVPTSVDIVWGNNSYTCYIRVHLMSDLRLSYPDSLDYKMNPYSASDGH